MRYLVLHDVEPMISEWAKARADFDLQSCDFSDAPRFTRDDGNVVLDIRWLLQRVDTIKYDGVIAVIKGEELKGLWGVHNRHTIGSKRFSIVQSEYHEGVYRDYERVNGVIATMISTRRVTDYPQPEYTFDHELMHSFAWLRGKVDILHAAIGVKMYDYYKGTFPVKQEEVPQPPTNTPNMLLPDTKKVLIINAGHHLNDSGATHGDIIERDECMKVRDAVVPILRQRGYEVHAVPDELTLSQSISWANTVAPTLDDGFALDIHFNSLSDQNVGGTEAFYGTSETSKEIAATLSQHVAEKLGIKSRGAKPDTDSAVGSLGWIRRTSMWASLLEVAFITNAGDMAAVKAENGYQRVAEGIADAIDEIFGHTPPEPPQPEPEPPVVCKITDFSDEELLAEVKRRMQS